MFLWKRGGFTHTGPRRVRSTVGEEGGKERGKDTQRAAVRRSSSYSDRSVLELSRANAQKVWDSAVSDKWWDSV